MIYATFCFISRKVIYTRDQRTESVPLVWHLATDFFGQTPYIDNNLNFYKGLFRWDDFILINQPETRIVKGLKGNFTMWTNY